MDSRIADAKQKYCGTSWVNGFAGLDDRLFGGFGNKSPIKHSYSSRINDFFEAARRKWMAAIAKFQAVLLQGFDQNLQILLMSLRQAIFETVGTIVTASVILNKTTFSSKCFFASEDVSYLWLDDIFGDAWFEPLA